jgi:hypothetical protein
VTVTLDEKRRAFVAGGRSVNLPTKLCRSCGALFFTSVGLDEHHRLGCGNGHGSPVTVRKLWRMTPARKAALEVRGLHVTALNNSRRIRCVECGKVSTPSGLALHQRGTGHTGRVEEGQAHGHD